MKIWECEFCKFTSVQKGNLRAHVLTVHEKQRNFVCDFCDYRAGTKGILKTHVKNKHLRLEKELFECSKRQICKDNAEVNTTWVNENCVQRKKNLPNNLNKNRLHLHVSYATTHSFSVNVLCSAWAVCKGVLAKVFQDFKFLYLSQSDAAKCFKK